MLFKKTLTILTLVLSAQSLIQSNPETYDRILDRPARTFACWADLSDRMKLSTRQFTQDLIHDLRRQLILLDSGRPLESLISPYNLTINETQDLIAIFEQLISTHQI
jgi:hypothetical protein